MDTINELSNIIFVEKGSLDKSKGNDSGSDTEVPIAE